MELCFNRVFKLVTSMSDNLVKITQFYFDKEQMCSQSLIGWWLKIDTQFCTQISVRISHGLLILQSHWQCTKQDTIFFSNLSLGFHFFSNFVENLQLCVKRYWFMFASHCNIWLLIGNCLYLNGLASQSKVHSSSYATIPLCVVIMVVAFKTAMITMQLGPKNHFALSKFLLYKFCYIPVSLFWKWAN